MSIYILYKKKQPAPYSCVEVTALARHYASELKGCVSYNYRIPLARAGANDYMFKVHRRR